MIKIILYVVASLLALLLFLLAFNSCRSKSKNIETQDYTQYVNPLIGTGEMGHVHSSIRHGTTKSTNSF